MARQKSPRVTLRSVAERAGVSTMTVSNVVNGIGKASVQTIAQVRQAIDELGYKPNLAARQLAGARATRIGLIYWNLHTPFLDAILVGALEAAAASGLQIIAMNSAGDTQEEVRDLVLSHEAQGIDALLLVPPFAERLNETGVIGTLGVPVAAIAVGGPMSGMITVRIDNRVAMSELTERLITQGHRRIGFISGRQGHTDAAERQFGYRDALARHDLPIEPALLVEGDFTFSSGIEAGRTLLDLPEPPTAIIASNDDMAAGLMTVALQRGMTLPRDLAVAGFDDTTLATRLWPALTSVRQPIGQMTYRATQLLIAALRDPDAAANPVDELLDFVLIERDSTQGGR